MSNTPPEQPGDAYASKEYYLGTYKGEQPQEDVLRLLSLAEIRIDEASFGRIRARGFRNLTEFQQEKVREAVCHQADYIAENGFESSGMESYSTPDISVTAKKGKSAAEKLHLCPIAYALLKQTGLTERLM